MPALPPHRRPRPRPQTTAPARPAVPPAEKISVVTTSNILADWVRTVGGNRVDVFSLLPANADPHTYQPGAQDIARVADADLIFSIGLSLERGWLEELIENVARDQDMISAVGDVVDPIDFVEIFDDHGSEGAEDLVGRLLIGDGETGMMSIIDLEHGDVEQDAFDLGSRAGRIDATKNGRFAIAVSSDANTAHVFDGGIYLEAHGDHFDEVEGPVERMGIDLSGDRPVHLYVGTEWATIFYDGSGDIVFLNEPRTGGRGRRLRATQDQRGCPSRCCCTHGGRRFRGERPAPRLRFGPHGIPLTRRRRNSEPDR